MKIKVISVYEDYLYCDEDGEKYLTRTSDITNWDDVTEDEYKLVKFWAKNRGYFVIRQEEIISDNKLISEIIIEAKKQKQKEEEKERKRKENLDKLAEAKKLDKIKKAKQLLRDAGEL